MAAATELTRAAFRSEPPCERRLGALVSANRQSRVTWRGTSGAVRQACARRRMLQSVHLMRVGAGAVDGGDRIT